MYAPRGQFTCADCDANRVLLDRNGWCGERSPGRLPILVGEPVDVCPAALGQDDPEALRLAALVPSPDEPDAPLTEFRAHELPPYYRDWLRVTRAWLSVYRARPQQQEGEPYG